MIFQKKMISYSIESVCYTAFLKRRFWDVLPATDTHPASFDADTILILLICFLSVYTRNVVLMLNYKIFALNN